MQKGLNFFLVVVMTVVMTSLTCAQEYRTVTGTANNPVNTTLGSVDGDVIRITNADFADGISQPAAPTRANPRAISNEIFTQVESIAESGKHSDYIWVFGQFIEHDISLIESNKSEPLAIAVPPCDPNFDPNCTGTALIPLDRAYGRAGTGTSISNPREYANGVTSFLDASNIYGADYSRASYLRTKVNGKLRLSEGDLLPFNTVNGEFNSGRDFSAPFMEMPVSGTNKWFVGGDKRANSNVLLSSMQILFVREHNRLADILKEKNPLWSDETLYQEAKLRTSAVIQAITYEEWLPALGIYLPDYPGYKIGVDPSLVKVFTVAAFRVGQTMINSTVKRMLENCEPHPNGDISLSDAFFNPINVLQDGGIEPLLKGMAAQDMQEMDGKMVDDVRNYIDSDAQEGEGIDFAAINIQRGREMGLPHFNDVRRTFGLPPYATFEEICYDPLVTDRLIELYGSVDNIDPWVGMLCEEHTNDKSLFGQTITTILKSQFAALRDGDRFYYENDRMLSEDEKDKIKSTRLSDVIKRNSSLRFMQDNVFFTEEECEHTNFELEPIMLDAHAYPNPVDDNLKVGIYSVMAMPVEIRIIDNTGRLVKIAQDDILEGMNIIRIDVANMHPGNYMLLLSAGAAQNQIPFNKF